MELNMIKHMERYARTDPNIISLGQGIPSGRPHEAIRTAVLAAITDASDVDVYSDPAGLLQLRTRLSDQLRSSGMQYDPDEIIVTCGAIEALNSSLLTIVSSDKDEVIISTPTYSAYERAVSVAKGVPVTIRLDETVGWRLDLTAVERAITERTAALLLCNPNNPTGTLYDAATLVALCELATKHDFMLILDEVYGNMLYDGAELYSPAAEACFKDNIIRIVSFSKDFNLTGWRIGYLHTSRQVAAAILPVHDTLVNCAPVVSQHAALAALDVADEIISGNAASYERRRDLMRHHLDGMRQWLSYQPVRGGYFFFVRLHIPINSVEFCTRLAAEARIVAVPGADFGAGSESYIRLCFGRSADDIQAGMIRLNDYLKRHYGSYRSVPTKEVEVL